MGFRRNQMCVSIYSANLGRSVGTQFHLIQVLWMSIIKLKQISFIIFYLKNF